GPRAVPVSRIAGRPRGRWKLVTEGRLAVRHNGPLSAFCLCPGGLRWGVPTTPFPVRALRSRSELHRHASFTGVPLSHSPQECQAVPLPRHGPNPGTFPISREGEL